MYHEVRNFAFSFEELNITSGQVEEVLGYLPGQSPEPFPEIINLALAKGPSLCDIKASILGTSNFSVDEEAGFFSFEDSIFIANQKLLSQLSRSEGAIIFICTAGPKIGEKSKEIMSSGDFMEGYILDLLGSVSVEATIEKIQGILISEFEEKGLYITNRYSPGYCGWALTEQKKIFSLFPYGHCGIKLSESCLMEPIKSVSGIIGFGSQPTKNLHECQLCELETCVYRKMRIARQK